MMRRLLVALFALALLATACGSDDDATATDTTVAADDTPATTEAMEEEPATTEAMEEEPATTEAMEEEPVEFEDVGYLAVNNMAHLPAFLASDFGLWADRGLNVDVQILGGGADIAAGLEAGQAEFGAVNATTGVPPQRAGGLLTKLIAPYNSDALNASYVDWISIVGRVDRGLSTDPQSIVGKTVGVTGGGTPRAYLGGFLSANGLTEDDIEIVTMGAPDMLTAVVNGDVDAVIPWDPFRTSALRQLGENGVDMTPNEAHTGSAIGIGAVDGQMEQRRDVFKAFIEGVVEATYLIRQDPEGAAPVVLNYIQGVTEEDAIEAMKRNSYDPRISICIRHAAEATSAQLVEQGRFELDTPHTGDDLTDSSLLDEVLAENPEWIADLPPLPENVEDCANYAG
ncbi:MAG: ABC transporter substrate-binding protein [Acidimicrobiia bacterium]|nr:ABC transporter substrate-binding protein [Acidimicrobiia bacterium]